MRIRLAINLVLSFGMLALCTWLVWPDAETRSSLGKALHEMSWGEFAPYLAGYVGLLIGVHLCRSIRWHYLLAPLGVRVPFGPLVAISSVGFMAILALPLRLGEFVRPGLLRVGGYATAAAGLGTVAVERIIDGLIISLLVFVAFFAHQSDSSPVWMMRTAYLALTVFGAATVFLVFALRRPEPTVRFCLSLTLLPRFAPRIADAIAHKLLDMIRGFAVLKDMRNFGLFLMWSLVYWGMNGLGMWLLAHAFHLELSLVGAYATMGLLGVGISLPNSPGMVGQFQTFTLLGLSLYLGFDLSEAGKHTAVYPFALSYAIAQHLIQVVWYLGLGALAFATPWVSLRDFRLARKTTDDSATAPAPTSGATSPAAVELVGAAEQP